MDSKQTFAKNKLKTTGEPTLADLDYELPQELIAHAPLPSRDQSRLLVINRRTKALEHTTFCCLPKYLRSGDVVVINDTRVIPAKITARRISGGWINLLLLKCDAAQQNIWQAMASPMKRLKPQEKLIVDTTSGGEQHIVIKDVFTGADGFKRLLVDFGSTQRAFELLKEIGSAPLPPYIHRQKTFDRQFDLERYQTIFADTPGAVAAPTAGLHFSANLLSEMKKQGTIICRLTLHVGAGTFKPISTSIEEHTIEPETFFISPDTAAQVSGAKAEGRRVIAVGTTTLRALEAAAAGSRLKPVNGEQTDLYVKPGYQFKMVDALITNFHLSRSSLLLLAATFAGGDLIMSAYQEAIKQRYRFFSYGDATFII